MNTKKKNISKGITALYWYPKLGFNAVSSREISCHSWNWLATDILSSPPFSFCQIGKRVGTSLELEWWLMRRLLWCTLPCWRTATLFSTNWATLQTPLPVYSMWGPGPSKPPTQRSMWALVFWLSTAHKPPTMSTTYHGPVLCVVHICLILSRASQAINIDKRWEPMISFEQWNYLYLPAKNWPLCTYRIHYDGDCKQWQNNAIQTTATWYSPGLCCGPWCYLGLALFVLLTSSRWLT